MGVRTDGLCERNRGTSPTGKVIYDSPLRYPGGKVSLAGVLAQIIELNGLFGCAYFEPFAGGAGAALRLLRDGVVSQLHLNDLDPRISAFWHAALYESERFSNTILSVPLSVAEWRRQKQICLRPDANKPFELGFATFYLNRCNRSGVVLGAAPIGGYDQVGKWRLDARFNRENLAERICNVARDRDRIRITNMDAVTFLVKHLPVESEHRRAFLYVDPPYYSNGNRLYLNRYSACDHEDLARYTQRLGGLNWVTSYDDTRFVRDLYASCVISQISLKYSLQRKRKIRNS